MKISLTIPILALFLFPAVARAQTPIKVIVKGEGDKGQEIADRVAGKIGSTERYALVSGKTDSELVDAKVLVSITCLNPLKGQETGVACFEDLVFRPLSDSALLCPLKSGMAVGPEDYVADSLFDYFVEYTSDEELKDATRLFKLALNATIAAHPNGVE